MTSMDKFKKSWNGKTGHIDCKIISKYVNDVSKPIYYISGPAKMVTFIHKAFNEYGIDDDIIRTEEFSGY